MSYLTKTAKKSFQHTVIQKHLFKIFLIDKTKLIRESIAKINVPSPTYYSRPFDGEKLKNLQPITEEEFNKIIAKHGINTCEEDPIPSKLHHAVDYVNTFMKTFADDTKLVTVTDTVSQCASLQEQIDSLSKWAEIWQTAFNFDNVLSCTLDSTISNTHIT